MEANNITIQFHNSNALIVFYDREKLNNQYIDY